MPRGSRLFAQPEFFFAGVPGPGPQHSLLGGSQDQPGLGGDHSVLEGARPQHTPTSGVHPSLRALRRKACGFCRMKQRLFPTMPLSRQKMWSIHYLAPSLPISGQRSLEG